MGNTNDPKYPDETEIQNVRMRRDTVTLSYIFFFDSTLVDLLQYRTRRLRMLIKSSINECKGYQFNAAITEKNMLEEQKSLRLEHDTFLSNRFL
jgi:hypothetical protein